MSQEDKPCSQHPDAPHGFDRNASHNAGRYVCECEGWEPVAAQEPVAKVLGALMTSGRSEIYAMESYKPLEVGVLLYANAEPCARCAELEREKFDWKKEFGEDRAENIELQAKITEQAARIKALESECRKLRDALSETEAFCNRKDITIERQRKVIKSAKTALENGLEYVQQALTDFDNQYRHHPAVENERVLLVKDAEELTAALAAIAELEKGVGG